MQSLLAERRDITALFCGSDILAAGALFECKQQGIAVPDDLSVVGFDNLEIAAFTDPPLSTLNVPAHDMGVEAAKYIIDGRNRGAAKRIEINVEFVDRKTTSPPRNII
jgi:LacI family transcriptional regulator